MIGLRTAAWTPTGVAVAVAAPAAAQDGWRLLGARAISGRVESDTIAVVGARRFGQVRLCVRNHNVRFRGVDIGFVNGGNQAVRLRSIIARDSCTGAIVLRGGRRDIASVAFSYDAASLRSGDAEVRVFAR